MIEKRDVFVGWKDYIEDLESFGWEKTEKVSTGYGRNHSAHYVLVRDTEMADYEKICNLEKKYETAKHNMKCYDYLEPEIIVLLFILFIIPGIIYVCYTLENKRKIELNNYWCQEEMNAAKDAAKKLIKG